MFALCGHLGAAPQHVSVRMRADLVSFSVHSAVNSHSLAKRLNAGQLHFTVSVEKSTTPAALFSDLLRKTHQGVFLSTEVTVCDGCLLVH